ncbi:MAG: diguanylate cyclase, partial [Parasphingorhabdus sp.]
HQKQKEAIRAVIRLPHLWESRQIMVSASLGIATYPENGQSLSELLKCSDQALYAEKSKRQRAG